VHLYVSDPTQVSSLLTFLRQRSYLAVQVAEQMLLVSPPPGSLSLEAVVRGLSADLEAWRRAHPSTVVMLGPITGRE